MDFEPADINDAFPRIPVDLLEALEERFPVQLPDLSTSDRAIWASVGRQQVIGFLRDMHERTPI